MERALNRSEFRATAEAELLHIWPHKDSIA
jgi:hypothetical protein